MNYLDYTTSTQIAQKLVLCNLRTNMIGTCGNEAFAVISAHHNIHQDNQILSFSVENPHLTIHQQQSTVLCVGMHNI
jgi:hypothetical protein